MKAGARNGDGVAIGPEDNAVVFDWEPSVSAGAEMLGRRGEDHRFEAPRPAAQRRRERDAERDEAGAGVRRFRALLGPVPGSPGHRPDPAGGSTPPAGLHRCVRGRDLLSNIDVYVVRRMLGHSCAARGG